MASGSIGPVPYIPDFNNLAFDSFVTFVVSALLAIMINAEAQAWTATLLGDYDPDAKERFSFNVFLHMSVLGSICYLVGGFGWPKLIKLNATKFKLPQLYTVIVRFTGAIANILLANIAASVVYVFKIVDIDPMVFFMVVGVNVTTAVYHLIPIPPLAASSLITTWIPEKSQNIRKGLNFFGPILLVAIFLAERITGKGLLSPYLNPIVLAAERFIVG